MGPTLTLHDDMNITGVNTKHLPNVFARKLGGCVKGSYLSYVGFSQLCSRTFTPSQHWDVIAPLAGHIQAIISVAAEKEVVRPYTEAIANIANRVVSVARMTHQLIIGDRPIMQFVRKTVSVHPLPWCQIEVSIPVLSASSPQPAPICLMDFTPKTFFWGDNPRPSIVANDILRLVIRAFADQQCAASACAKGLNRGRISLHDEPPIRCAVPRDVLASPWLLAAYYSTNTAPLAQGIVA